MYKYKKIKEFQNSPIKYYTLAEASKEIGIQVRTARKYILIGKMHAIKSKRSGRWYVRADEVKRLKDAVQSSK